MLRLGCAGIGLDKILFLVTYGGTLQGCLEDEKSLGQRMQLISVF